MPEILAIHFPGDRLLTAVFGLALLLAGRRIFWLVLGVIGFFFGFDLASRVLGLESQGLGLLIGLFAGLVGVAVAIFLQKVAVGVAGFLIGGYLTAVLLQVDPASLTVGALVAFAVGGLVCAFLALWLFEAALILLSSLAGAALLTQALALAPAATALAFLVLVVVGIAVQAGIGPRRRRRAAREAD
ncbi:MAG TPA: hypothetical protein VM599_00165 [Thermoanaerobaculia bacterium]|nr:hypothetical protein [Thermoanaerobaculia bacterium]